MLPSRQKLSRKSFPKHDDPKTNWRGVFLQIRFYQKKHVSNEVLESPKFAVVISKKIHNLATKRNEIRRIIYQVISEHQEDFVQYVGVKFIILPLKVSGIINKQEIKAEIKLFLKKQ